MVKLYYNIKLNFEIYWILKTNFVKVIILYLTVSVELCLQQIYEQFALYEPLFKLTFFKSLHKSTNKINEKESKWYRNINGKK